MSLPSSNDPAPGVSRHSFKESFLRALVRAFTDVPYDPDVVPLAPAVSVTLESLTESGRNSLSAGATVHT